MFCIGPSKGVEDWICNNDFNWNWTEFWIPRDKKNLRIIRILRCL
jgi:hypothetical protein